MDFSKRLPVTQNISSTIDWRVASDKQQSGWQLPCSVVSVDPTEGLVTVKFRVQNTPFAIPDITIPVLGWEYIRYPIQVGDSGVTVSCDVDITAISGQGSTDPDLSNAGNLTQVLMFMPIMNKNFTPSPNSNATWIYGPDGVILQDKAGNCIATIHHDSSLGITLIVGDSTITSNSAESTISFGSNHVKVSSSGVDIVGTLVINGQPYTAHTHYPGSYANGGGAVTGTSGGKV